MKKKILFILIIAIVSFQLVVFSIQKHEVSGWLGNLRWATVPFHRGWLVVQNGLDQVVSNFTSKRILLEENKSLQKEVGRLQNELTILTEQIRELEMKFTAGAIEKQIPFDVVPSLVIGRDPYDWFGKLIIDKGTNDEIIPDLTVVTYQGLVGRVEQTYPNYSIVRLILSSEIATGAILQRTRDLGVVEGNGRGLCWGILHVVQNLQSILSLLAFFGISVVVFSLIYILLSQSIGLKEGKSIWSFILRKLVGKG
jgi:rod shape-determining protein MreC